MKNHKSQISNRKSNKAPRFLSGTREWADINFNIQRGCEHNCRYCYARYNAVVRFQRCSLEDWAEPVINQKSVDRDYRKYPGNIMFPSSHDITERNLSECMIVLRKLLDAGNQVLIVSKPYFKCITLMCEQFKQYRRQIIFRFTIGSTRDDVLTFWEPKAPNFSERIASLQYAFHTGYATSVSCEPFLDGWPDLVYEACVEWLTDSFWLGLLRDFDKRVDLDGIGAELIEKYVAPLKHVQRPICIMAYYKELKNKPYMMFKDSIRKIVESYEKK